METRISMEAETIPILVLGFSFVITITAFFIFLLWRRKKDLSYSWFIGQISFLLVGFNYALKVIGQCAVPRSMASEDASLAIGLSAMFWALSMMCMVTGIWKISKTKG